MEQQQQAAMENTTHTGPWIQQTEYGTNHVAARGFQDLDGRASSLRIDVWTNSRDGGTYVEGRHTARKGGPDYSPMYCHRGSGSGEGGSCGWCYLNASHTEAAHEQSKRDSLEP